MVTLDVSLRARRDDFVLDVAFESPATGITALFGPSGAGKTLTLRHLAGLERAESGRVALGDRILFGAAEGTWIPARERRIGLVFQEYALFPHLTVGGNVGFGLHGRSRDERAARVAWLLELVGLRGYEERKPSSLSGGERQRIALARALAPRPDLLLLDEPFAALDFRIREDLRASLLAIQRETGVPMVLVTHALEDVRALAEVLVLIDGGRVVATGPTSTLLDAPPSPEAAALVGRGDVG
ncbi:MAG: ABC transporter ATP-binding protein [Gemmatimonadota bacterium]|nr:ABC transporter ATP-binding protein [Gemmatimonadota bacterium]